MVEAIVNPVISLISDSQLPHSSLDWGEKVRDRYASAGLEKGKYSHGKEVSELLELVVVSGQGKGDLSHYSYKDMNSAKNQ